MSRRSLESERPIMAPSISSKRASHRLSTYSAFASSPSFSHSRTTSNHHHHHHHTGSSPSSTTTSLETAGLSEIRHLTAGLDRLGNKRLDQQRFVPSDRKQDDLSKLALGAKLERALDRRMVDQDAVLKVKDGKKKKKAGGLLVRDEEKRVAEAKG